MGKILGKIIKWCIYVTGIGTIIVLLVVALSGRSVRTELRSQGQSENPVTQNYVPIQPAPNVPNAEPEVKAPVKEPVVEVEEEEPGIVELGLYQEITENYSNPSFNPSVQVGADEAVFGTADPGSLSVGGVDKDSEGFGFVFAVYNKSDASIDVSFTTSYNGNPTTGNDHWNISPVLVKVNDPQALTDRVNALQKADAKPKVLYFIWDGVSLIPQN